MKKHIAKIAGMHDSLHRRFELQAQRWPQRIALSCGEQQLNYQQLNERASDMARKLRSEGVRSGDLVALMLPRGIELIVQVLAVLKAGAGYVPIDPNYPLERVEWMLRSSDPVRLLTQREFCARLWGESPPPALLKCILWTDNDPQLEEFTLPGSSETEPEPSVKDKGDMDLGDKGLDLAYIIFTSGSTGKPKGVMVGHHQVLSLLDAALPKLHCDHNDVWTLFHSLAFDFSVWELWGALTTGARLCIVPQDVCWSPENFASLLREQHVTILNQTPSAFYALTQAETQARAKGAAALSLRSVIFGGEALNLHQIRNWWACYPPGQPRLINMYGITETTVHVTWLELTPSMIELDGSPIGEALSGLEVHLLDRALKPVADGEIGEIHVAGRQLAQGYLGRLDLTASRFVASPFHEGQRLYRSGDLAQRLNGQLFYVGRADRQLKIRGFRIESGEVEAEIETHPAVQRCVVLPQPAPEGQMPENLLAFLVASSDLNGPLPDSASLRQYLASRLPVHCLPAECLFVETLPLTVNGKLDGTLLLQHWQAQKQGTNGQQQRLELLRARLAKTGVGKPESPAKPLNQKQKLPYQETSE